MHVYLQWSVAVVLANIIRFTVSLNKKTAAVSHDTPATVVENHIITHNALS